jgi:hypothetical protein
MDLERGRFAEIRADATQVWPFLVRYVMERMPMNPDVPMR